MEERENILPEEQMAGRENLLQEQQMAERDIDKIGSEEITTDVPTSKVHSDDPDTNLPEEAMAEQKIEKIESKEVATSPVHATTSKVNLDEQQKKLPEEDTAEQEIDKTESKELMAQNLMDLLHQGRLVCLIIAFIMCVIIHPWSTGIVVGFISILGMVLFDMVLHFLVGQYSTVPYLRTVAVVVQDYALLITINRKFLEIAIIPFSILAFIGAVGSKVSNNQSGEDILKKGTQLSAKEQIKMAWMRYTLQIKSTSKSLRIIFPFIGALGSKVSKYRSGEDTLIEGTQLSAKELMTMAMVPYLLQLILVVCTQYKGQVGEGNIFTFSSFLLFLDSALSTLTVMIASPPIRYSPGVDQVLPAMHRTCIVMLMLTAHSMAAEWLGGDMVLACMLELISVFAWFTICCHYPKHEQIINSITSRRSPLVIILGLVGAILLVSLYAVDDRIGLRSWIVRVLCISISSSALSYLDGWLLDHWSAESTPNYSSRGLVQLLKFSSVFGSSVSAFIAAAYFLSHISHSYQLMLPLCVTMLAMLIGPGLLFIPPIRLKIQRWARLNHEMAQDQVLPAMHKTYIVMLTLAAHLMATEWLGEDMVLACIPELISVLAWFTIYCHHPELLFVITNRAKSWVIKISSVVVAILLVCLGSLYAEDKIILRSWFVRALCISSTSWALPYLGAWLLDRWTAECTPNPTVELVQLLEFSSVFGSSVSVCFIAAAYFLSLIQLPFYITVLAMLIGSGLVHIPPLRMADLERMVEHLTTQVRKDQEDRSRRAEIWKAKMMEERMSTQMRKDQADRSCKVEMRDAKTEHINIPPQACSQEAEEEETSGRSS